MRTLEQMGKDPRIGTRLGQYMGSAGFENIHTFTHVLPIGPWKEGMPFQHRQSDVFSFRS